MKTYFDPHPGLMGCTVRLPEPVRIRANEIAGMPLSDDEVLSALREVAPPGATFEIVEHDDENLIGEFDREHDGDGMLTMRINTEPAPGCTAPKDRDSVFAPHNSWRVLKWRWFQSVP